MPLISYPRTDGSGVISSASDSFGSTGYRSGAGEGGVRLKHDIGLVVFRGWRYKKFPWTKRFTFERDAYRKEYKNKVRRKFIKMLAENKELLRMLGITEQEIEDMEKKGKNPKGYQVHHKIPLDDGGTNDFDNLVLIKNLPYHELIHSSSQDYQQAINKLKPGETVQINFPVPGVGISIWPLHRDQPVEVIRRVDPEVMKNWVKGLKKFKDKGIDFNEKYI